MLPPEMRHFNRNKALYSEKDFIFFELESVRFPELEAT